MDVIEYLGKRLVHDHELKELEALALPEAKIVRDAGLQFVGTGQTRGTELSVGLVRADGMAEERMTLLAQTFFAVMVSKRGNEGFLPPNSLMGTSFCSCGLLCFVFEDVPDHRSLMIVQNARQGSEDSPDCRLSWALDVRQAVVHTHVGQSLETPFGTDYLERVLREYQAMRSTGC